MPISFLWPDIGKAQGLGLVVVWAEALHDDFLDARLAIQMRYAS